MTTASMLLKSWAMPPVSWPTASIFCTCRSCSSALRRSADLLDDPLLERRVERLQRRFGSAALGQFPLGRLEQPRIVDRGRAVAGDAEQRRFVLQLELAGLAMAEEQAAQHFARARDDRHREIAANRQMAFGHAVVRRVLAIARVFEDIVRADHRRAAEGRLEHGGVARHRELLECFARRPERA